MTDTMFEEIDIPQDSVPHASDVEYPCVECGREAGPYSGRGRKPTRCPEHKKTSTRSKAPGTKGSNATLAEQATEALWQINGMAAFLAMLSGFQMTGAAIQEREEAFRQQCYAALLTDPNMCRTILKAGTNSSKVALVACYGMFAAGVVPTLMMEMRMRKEAKLAAQADAEQMAAF